jgi:hypothetical protein
MVAVTASIDPRHLPRFAYDEPPIAAPTIRSERPAR